MAWMSCYEVSVTVWFRASHAVRTPEGALEASHEHQWAVTAAFRARALNAAGFVIDFLALRAALDGVTEGLAGKDLNAICPPAASAERLAEHLAGKLAGRVGVPPHAVRVVEAPGCEAAYYPGGEPPALS